MAFEFINNNNLNDATKKRIRSHAALGKNKGKKISRPPRKDALTTVMTSFRVPLIIQRVSEAKRTVEEIERPLDDGLFFPGLLPGESKGLVKKVISFMSSMGFSPELDDGLDYGGLGTPICVQYMFVDEACFHSTMAIALSSLDNLLTKPEGKVQAMRHVSHTFRLVNQKLCGQSALTDSTIAAIVSMAQYEHHQNRIQQGSVHAQGLWQITQLRGGVSNLITSVPGLGLKLLRVDLEYSLQLGSPTLFSLEDVEMGCKPISKFPSMCPQSGHSLHPLVVGRYPVEALTGNWRDILVDVLFLTSLLNNAIAGFAPRMNAIELYHDVILLGYRLVKLNPLCFPLGLSSLQNRVHLGLAAFLMTFLLSWDGRVVQNDLLSELLLSEVQQPFGAGQDDQGTLLWLLFIGAASSSLWKHPIWVATTKHTLQGLEVMSWEDVKKLLAGFPWVNAVHDTAGQALWDGSKDVDSRGTDTSKVPAVTGIGLHD